jgi:hypothetical protein
MGVILAVSGEGGDYQSSWTFPKASLDVEANQYSGGP